MRVVVLGAGLTGLSAAHRLRAIAPDAEVVVVDGARRVGGIVGTTREDGFVVEEGPDSFITDKPWGLALVEELGLSGELISTRKGFRGAYVVCRGKLERIPEGFSLLAPSSLSALAKSPVLSWRGKARAALEPMIPRGENPDPSLSEFVTRRFGKEVLDRLAQPLVSGIYGADPSQLSLAATMPRFLDLERRYGSLIRGLKAQARQNPTEKSQGARYGLFVSFRSGMQALTEALVSSLSARVDLDCRVRSVSPQEGRYRIETERQTLIADAVICALPGPAAADVLRPLDGDLSARIAAIPHGTTATVTFAFPEEALARPIDAFGFVVPQIERRDALASTWASTKFEGRAPPGYALLRVFLGGNGRESLLAERDDEGLTAIALRELDALIGVRGAPRKTWVRRYPISMPQYHVGHLKAVEGIERLAKIYTGFALAGTYLRGVGIPDSIRQGREAAEQVNRSRTTRAPSTG